MQFLSLNWDENIDPRLFVTIIFKKPETSASLLAMKLLVDFVTEPKAISYRI
ncbi:hypothetical protein [Flavobacterium xueshanense]|uniref:hypothetical protein n=1 Tax=Flavobacterium xueshanense TaxID=935223 RepID=UPI00142F3472|nr:hypothetical protein [Flavobacterium xueshanense]